ncbi:MAG: pentapeptide repeat-containing protein [Caulobacteraceae bacterium]|nr:pentapeptide repeat-containing protein [Caulobacteraceae bacterium]
MMSTKTIHIRNRWTGDVQASVEIECAPDALPSVKLGLAVRVGFERGANLDGAYLAGANLDGANLDGASLVGAYLAGANLDGANLDGASLVGAYLAGASLVGASLAGASLDGASLVGASLDGASLDGASLAGKKIKRLLARATRLDGYEFQLWLLAGDDHIIRAGCQTRTIASYREHVAKDYPGRSNAADVTAETTAILDYFEARLTIAGALVEAGR